MTYLLGIDIGTTNIKVIAFDEAGRVGARASEPTPTIHQGPGRAVHRAEDLWLTAAGLTRRVTEQLGPHGAIAGVAVASMGEEGFPLDEQGQPVYPGILWWDERTRDLVPWWQEHTDREHISRLTGLSVGHTFTALKLQWLQQNEPEVMHRTAHWLWVGDYIAFRLTGVMATTPSLASRSMLYNLSTGTWSDEMARTVGISPAILPPIVPSGTIMGNVSSEAAARTGLPSGLPVAGGGHDHICGFLAAGAVEPGDVIHSGGTAEALARIVAPAELGRLLASAPELSAGAHVIPHRYYLERGRHTGAVISWWERLLAGQEPIEALRRAAQEVPEGANGLVFLPYMLGKAPPGANPLATGSLLGLTTDHTAADVLRAVGEGVCYDTVELQHVLRPEGGGAVTVIGGLARNPLWLQLKANILGVSVLVPEQAEAVAQGAALLAGLATGLFPDRAAMLAGTLRWAKVVEPEPEAVRRYGELYQERYLPATSKILPR